jgi:hypothetical protein
MILESEPELISSWFSNLDIYMKTQCACSNYTLLGCSSQKFWLGNLESEI